MPSININLIDDTRYMRTDATNGYTVFVPALVSIIPDGLADVYAKIVTIGQLNKYYSVKENLDLLPESEFTSADIKASYVYASGLLAAGYALLFKPITVSAGTQASTIADALAVLQDTTQMDITDRFAYEVDFLTDGGLCFAADSTAITNLNAIYKKVYTALNTQATTRQDCMVIPGIYNGCASANANSALDGIKSKYTAAPYAPGLTVPTPVVGSKLMDGAYVFLITLASSLRTNNIWYPPAGVSRMVVSNGSNPEYDVPGTLLNKWQNTEPTEGTHYVNPIMNIRNYGYTIFGQRTMVLDSTAFRNINTVLMTNTVRRAIFNIGIGLMFDQNEVTTWTLFKTRLGTILESIRADRGLTDYRIIMNETTTTPEDLQANRLRGKVYVSVVSVVEDIVIDFYVEPQNVVFD